MILVSGLLLGMTGLVTVLPGCGSGAGGGGGGGGGDEVKIAPAVNPAKDTVPVSEEYKSLSPAGKATK